MNNKTDFESALQRLDDILKILEAGNTGLDEALGLFEEGISLVRSCGGELKTAEQRVRLLTENADGSVHEEAFTVGGDEN